MINFHLMYLMQMGVVSEDKLLELLELAMSSNATETVRRARELMDSGVDPLVLISQLVTIIVDIIAGTYPNVDAKNTYTFFGGRTRKFIAVTPFVVLHLAFHLKIIYIYMVAVCYSLSMLANSTCIFFSSLIC